MQDMDAVYRQHFRMVYQYLMSLTHQPDVAENWHRKLSARLSAVSTAMTEAARSLHGFVPLPKINICPICESTHCTRI